ncbi:tryptophan 7-halogenase [Duganella sp. BJB488]|uniref:tryptophan halogenase family protein n=1 Tax=unclassified Duganella TaxID=2636909 RepID=UPI000E35350C|nr:MULTISPECIES: tryptophan halogenase family protein [unclassified Duganella]RFP13939.1 tryptophan 7-halogenase [Duganella sp. BJB489]RFP17478.1 tryptophan 7-halogenase [Duganella sp. BJB488]RFP31734.1 tryptophan 7-halogenase [Duganella sp. BJB480]
MVRRIVIVGGGSAGWLTAGLIAADHQGSSLHITLIESPDIAPIGVGEGTWPSMRDTLRRIGVSESDFFRECDASFKQGSRFNRWVTGADNDYYFHPFVLPQGYDEVNLPEQWLAQHPDIPFADLVSYQPHLCVNGRAPKQVVTPEFSSVANYGYHLDAGKFGVFLRKHCLEKLGVHYVPDNVAGVASHDNGDIAALHTQAHGALEGDLFIDCTGMQSLLLGKHYQVPFLSQKHVLYNDTALAVQVPYPDDNYPIASQTSSTAQSAGWIWDIGLPTRRGVGHVYSSAHIGGEQAEAELRRYISDTGGPQDIPPPRKLSFNPGYRERFWHRNCVAIGLSAGFIEPLEASALALAEMSAAMVSDELPATRAAMDIVAARFNEAFTYRWERVIDFLKLHYVLSQRRDSDYWRDNTASVPERLGDLLTLWRHRAPSRNDFNRIEEVFPWASYQYVLYGMGFRSEFTNPQPRQAALADGYFREAAELTHKMLGGLPDNRTLINHIKRHGLQKI